MQRGRNSNPYINYLKMFLFTTLSAAVTATVLLLVSAVLLEKLGLGPTQVQWLVWGIYIITGMTAGLLAGKWKRERKFMWGVLAGLVWLLVVLVVSLCMKGSTVEAGAIFPAVVCILGGGMVGGMLA